MTPTRLKVLTLPDSVLAQGLVPVADGAGGFDWQDAAAAAGGIQQSVADTRYVAVGAKGAANGVADLDSGSKLPSSRLPSAVVSDSSVDSFSPVAKASTISANQTKRGLRDLLSALDYGVIGDCNQHNITITISGGSLSQGTLTGSISDLQVGHTLVIDGVGNVVVQSVSGTAVTFTGAAATSCSGSRFMYGTDNTTALNAWFADLLANRRMGLWPAGKYLITGTIGRADGATTGYAGLTVICGGASLNSMWLEFMASQQGTSLVWGGAAGGTMMTWNRLQHVHWIGGLNFVGQPVENEGGTLTPFCNRAGLGYLVSQNSTPSTGTGYHHFDDVVFSDMALGFQFGENTSDNNCDTTRFGRLIANRCDQVGLYYNTESISHQIDWCHLLSSTRGIVSQGGNIHFGQMNISACVGALSGVTLTSAISGTVTSLPVSALNVPLPNGIEVLTITGTTVQKWITSSAVAVGATAIPVGSQSAAVTFPVGTYVLGGSFALEARGTSAGWNYVIDELYSEGGSSNIIYVGASQDVNVGSYHDDGNGGSNTNSRLFYIAGGGTLRMEVATLINYDLVSQPFYLRGDSSTTGKLLIERLRANGPSAHVDLKYLIAASSTAINDVKIGNITDFAGNTYAAVNTKLLRGDVSLIGVTTSTTALSLGFFGSNLIANLYGYSCRIPRGYSVLNIYVVGDRGDGTYSVFRRQMECHRESSGNTTVVSTTTIGTDSVQGTDHLTLSVDATTHVLNVLVGGTASKTISWQAQVSPVLALGQPPATSAPVDY